MMRLTTVHLPRQLLNDLDELVRQEKFANRSEAIRVAIRDLILKELPSYCPHCKIKIQEGTN